MKVPKIFNNEVVHYALIFLAVLNVVGYVAAKAYECLVLFGVGYYAANTYIKNVGLSILAALFLSNFVFGCGRVTESFVENMKGSREHMVDAAKSAQKAAFEGLNETEKEKEKFARYEGFMGRRTIEGFREGAKKKEEAVKENDTVLPHEDRLHGSGKVDFHESRFQDHDVYAGRRGR